MVRPPRPARGGNRRPTSTQPLFSSGRRTGSVLLLLALLLLGVAVGSAARARRLHAQELVERYRALARERDQSAALARAAERAHIAREMHDVVAHSVSVMVALADGADAAFERAPDRSRDAVRQVARTGRSALADMQRVLGALGPHDGDDGHGADGGRPADPRRAVRRRRAARDGDGPRHGAPATTRRCAWRCCGSSARR